MHVYDLGIILIITVGQHLSDVPSVEKSWGYSALTTFKIFCTNKFFNILKNVKIWNSNLRVELCHLEDIIKQVSWLAAAYDFMV